MMSIRKLYSPDAFDDFIKAKLNEAEIDPVLSEKYWQSLESNSFQRTSKKIYLGHWLGAFVFVIVMLLLLKMMPQTSSNVLSGKATYGKDQVHTYTYPLKEKSEVHAKPPLNKAELPKPGVVNNPSTYESKRQNIRDFAPTISTDLVNTDSVMKEEKGLHSLTRSVDTLKQMDSVQTKPAVQEEKSKKRKPAFIIW